MRKRSRGPLGFTKGQQGEYRPMVYAAWARHCRFHPEALQAADKAAAKRDWYEDELEIATGQTSTRFCDRKRDFEAAMQHFEELSESGIYWAMRVYGADARRFAYSIRELCQAHDVDEDYMRGMARRSLGLGAGDILPELANFEYEQLIVLMGELKRFLRRGGRPGVKQEEVPF